MKLPFIPHRRINKILCLSMLSMAVIFLALGGVFTLLDGPDMGLLLCVPAVIAGGFSLLYGILWGVYGRKERMQQKRLERATQVLSRPADDIVTYQEFVLPRAELIAAAKRRFQKIAVALLLSDVIIFVVLYGFLCVGNGYAGIGHLISVMVFCLLMVLPGILMQYLIFQKYARAVPERIQLFPGKLILDGRQFCTNEIKRLTVSSFLSASRDTSVLYRKLIVSTEKQTREYAIDYRFASEDTPHWREYGTLLQALRIWAEQNQVRLTVDYMN